MTPPSHGPALNPTPQVSADGNRPRWKAAIGVAHDRGSFAQSKFLDYLRALGRLAPGLTLRASAGTLSAICDPNDDRTPNAHEFGAWASYVRPDDLLTALDLTRDADPSSIAPDALLPLLDALERLSATVHRWTRHGGPQTDAQRQAYAVELGTIGTLLRLALRSVSVAPTSKHNPRGPH